jgi:hypothetical protein
MKTFKTLFFATLFMIVSTTLSAQYQNGYGGGNGYGNNGYGRSNSMGQMGQQEAQQMSAPKPVPIQKTVAKIVEYYKKELKLDALQEVVFTNIFLKSIKKEEVILANKEMSDDDKRNELKVLSELVDLEVKQVLNKEQKGLYQNIVDERKSKMESRKH